MSDNYCPIHKCWFDNSICPKCYKANELIEKIREFDFDKLPTTSCREMIKIKDELFLFDQITKQSNSRGAKD